MQIEPSDNRLKYQIDSWDKLTKCQSNTSRKLYITVSEFTRNATVEGKRISVFHEIYGILFSCIVNARGRLLDNEVEGLTTSQILQELSRFGFLVRFEDKIKISDKQLYSLRGAYDLGFDYARTIAVWSYDRTSAIRSKVHIVAFSSSYNQDWLNSGYSPSEDEYLKAISSGQAFSLDTVTDDNRLDWSWMVGSVYRIVDILSKHQEQLYAMRHRLIAESKSDEDVQGGAISYE